jgi:hypothetical protein
MPNYQYLIVGGGMTAAAAVHGIREVDRSGSIGLLSAEGHPPYDRPPLSKKLWKGKPLESIWRQIESRPALARVHQLPADPCFASIGAGRHCGQCHLPL